MIIWLDLLKFQCRYLEALVFTLTKVVVRGPVELDEVWKYPYV